LIKLKVISTKMPTTNNNNFYYQENTKSCAPCLPAAKPCLQPIIVKKCKPLEASAFEKDKSICSVRGSVEVSNGDCGSDLVYPTAYGQVLQTVIIDPSKGEEVGNTQVDFAPLLAKNIANWNSLPNGAIAGSKIDPSTLPSVQSDYAVTNINSPEYIKNKPTAQEIFNAMLPQLSGIVSYNPLTGLYTNPLTAQVTSLQTQINTINSNGGGSNGNGGTGTAPTPPAYPSLPAKISGFAQASTSSPVGAINGSTTYTCGSPYLTWAASSTGVTYEVREGVNVIQTGITGTSFTIPANTAVGSHTYSVYSKSAGGVYSAAPLTIGPVTIVNCNTNGGGNNGGTGTGVTGKMYVANAGSNNVSEIDLATNTVTATILVGAYPVTEPLLNNQKTKLYVLNSGSNNISIIDLATKLVTKTIQLPGIPKNKLIINASGTNIYALCSNNTISVINTTTDLIVATAAPSTAFPLEYMVLDSAGILYVGTNISGGYRYITNQTIDQLMAGSAFVGNIARDFIIDQTGTFAYSTINSDYSVLRKARTSDGGVPNGVVDTYIGAGPQANTFFGITLDPLNQNIYSISAANQLVKTNINTMTTVNNKSLSFTLISPNSNQLKFLTANKIYVSDYSADKVNVVYVSDGGNGTQADKAISVGDGPNIPTIDTFNNRLYVTNKLSNSTTVIDTLTDTVIATIPVGLQPSSSPVIT
jgi:YVTN family beta-propeller protein